MKKINKIILYYFIFALPVILLALIIWPAFTDTKLAIGSTFYEWGNAVVGYMFGAWVLAAFYVVIHLVVSSKFREQLLKRITSMKERDEREEIIVGKSARNVFLFNLALLIFLFILNLVTVNITKYPENQRIAGKGHSISLGLNYSPIKKSANNQNKIVGKTVFNYDFPITVGGVLLILIIANLGAFYFYSRRLNTNHKDIYV